MVKLDEMNSYTSNLKVCLCVCLQYLSFLPSSLEVGTSIMSAYPVPCELYRNRFLRINGKVKDIIFVKGKNLSVNNLSKKYITKES